MGAIAPTPPTPLKSIAFNRNLPNSVFRRFHRSQPKSDPNAFFKTDHLEANLKRQSVKGGAATLASQGFKFALQMGSTAVLARLLMPEDYGLIGMTTAVTSFIQLFKDMGLSEATVQCKETNHQQISTLFWLNCLVGTGLAGLAIAVSPLVAYFYNEPRIVGVMNVLSVNFIVSSAAVQHTALLKRQMQFVTLAKAGMLAMAVGVGVAIVSASQGLGYWALVLMFMATIVTESLCVWIACPWRPGWPVLNSGIGSMLSFGGNLVGFNCVNYFSRNLDNILIGRVWGPQELGLYAKAYQLVLLPINQINRPATSVAMPTLSRLQDQPEKYKRYYYKALSLITMVGMPIVCFLFVVADDVILFLLGEQWLGVVPIFRLLMPAAFIGTFNVALGWAFQSLGRTGRQFKLGIVTASINVVIFILSVRWGAIGIAAAYGLSRPMVMAANLLVCYRGTFLKTSDLIRTLALPGTASICSAVLLFVTIQLVLPEEFPVLVRLTTKFSIYSLSYLSFWVLIPKNRESFSETLQIMKSLKNR